MAEIEARRSQNHKHGKANLGGIRYRVDVHEGMVTFVELDRMSCTRITVQKCEPHGLLYVESSSSTGFTPFAHVERAVAICETLLGPNHFRTIADRHRFERNNALRNVFRRLTFSFRQRLFWTYEIPFRCGCLWRTIKLVPKRTPHVEWQQPEDPCDLPTNSRR